MSEGDDYLTFEMEAHRLRVLLMEVKEKVREYLVSRDAEALKYLERFMGGYGE